MKKATSKLLSFLIAGAMLTAMGATAFADGETNEPAEPQTPTIHTAAYLEEDTRTVHIQLSKSASSNAVAANHSYTAIKLLDLYKVMEPDTVTGEAGSEVVTQRQMKDGNNKNVYQYAAVDGGLDLATLLNVTDGLFKYDAASGAITLATDNDITSHFNENENSSDAATLAALIAQACVSQGLSGTTITLANGQADLECGYWVIFENNDSGNDGTVATKPILLDVRTDSENVAEGQISITLKDANVDVDKTITNDDANNDKQNVVSIGDVVSYKVDTNFPIYEANVENAYTSEHPMTFTITDTLSDGLDLLINDTTYPITIKVNNETVEAGENTYVLTTGTHSVNVAFKQAFIIAHQGQAIEVTYSAKLNQSAVYNSEDANGNSVEVTYSNNPEVNTDTETITTDVPGDTPEDPDEPSVKVYTFAFDLRKLDGAHTSYLEGVKFNLLNNGAAMKFVRVDEHTYIYDSSLQSATEGVTTDIMTVDGDITIIGLDEGTYTLHEVETVAGYSLLANDAVITITANTVEAAEGETATELTGGATLATTYATIINDDNAQAGETTSAVTALDGDSNLNVVVRNYKGINLPETGSIAALTISGLGLAVALAGAAYMVAKKKKDEE